MSELAPELVAGLVLESDRPEWAALSGEALWIGTASLTALAANFGYVGVRNPAGSGLLVRVDGLMLDTDALTLSAIYLLYTGVVSALIGGSTAFFRDSRWGFGGGCPVFIIADNNASGVLYNGPVARLRTPTAGAGDLPMFFRDIPFILSPGFDLVVRTPAVNEPSDITVWGSVRPFMQESEQTKG